MWERGTTFPDLNINNKTLCNFKTKEVCYSYCSYFLAKMFRSELIQRKFTIAKSLLSKADKSSFDRLCGQVYFLSFLTDFTYIYLMFLQTWSHVGLCFQIYGLEMEQKKLEEDTVVYNRLQEQLKLSPAYKKVKIFRYMSEVMSIHQLQNDTILFRRLACR